MKQKEARKIMLWKAIERYRTAGGREEHHAYKEALEVACGNRCNADLF